MTRQTTPVSPGGWAWRQVGGLAHPLVRRRGRGGWLRKVRLPGGPWRSLLLALLVGLTVLTVQLGQRWLDRGADDGTVVDPLLLQFFGSDFVLQPKGSFRLDDLELVSSTSQPFGSYLRVSYPKGSSSPTSARTDGTVLGGTQFYLRTTPAVGDRAYLRYFLRLPEDFAFVRGGKLPGLYGGVARADGSGQSGFSTRFGWSENGAGELYTYASAASAQAQPLGRGTWTWPAGRWVCVEQEVDLGRPQRREGRLQVWVDGERVWQQDRLALRDSDTLRVDGVFFSTFFGGGDASWATPRAQWADFAAVEVAESRIGCSPR